MEYRTLGRTGLEVSAMGLGTEYLHGPARETVAAVVAEAVAHGVNYFDVLFSYADYLDSLGAALRGRREEVFLAVHLGCAETEGQYRRSRDPEECRRNFHDALRRLGTDYADVIVVQNCDEQEDYEAIMAEGGLCELAEQLRAEGKGRFLGLSSHVASVPTQAGRSGHFDVLMVPVHPREAGPEWREFFQFCTQENLGLVAMKPFAGGGMFQAREGQSAATPVQCLSYTLAQPGVSTTVPGMAGVEELRAGLRYFDASPEERDFRALLAATGTAGACTYCNHCTPCTQGIMIGQTIRLLDQAARGLTDDLRAAYRVLPGAPASACLVCGACRARCPFGVDTPARIAQAAEAFERRERY